jgi:hypothetical protein
MTGTVITLELSPKCNKSKLDSKVKFLDEGDPFQT